MIEIAWVHSTNSQLPSEMSGLVIEICGNGETHLHKRQMSLAVAAELALVIVRHVCLGNGPASVTPRDALPRHGFQELVHKEKNCIAVNVVLVRPVCLGNDPAGLTARDAMPRYGLQGLVHLVGILESVTASDVSRWQPCHGWVEGRMWHSEDVQQRHWTAHPEERKEGEMSPLDDGDLSYPWISLLFRT